MLFIRGLHNLRPHHRSSVVTVGNFDGVHLGHQAIIKQVVNKARKLNCKATVILFEPQPAEFFAPDKAPARLMLLRDKLNAIKACNVDQVLCIPFNREFSSLTAQDFVERILVNGLGVRYLVVGDDFRFGKGRQGDFAFLQQAGTIHHFDVCDTTTVQTNNERISSTRIRAAINEHNFALAAQLLGRPYCISGRVRYGDQLGRTLDCPTANLLLSMVKAPVAGIYAVTVSGAGLNHWQGVASCGTRPTVNGKDNRLEVHLLDFSGDLYGKLLTVEFKRFIRPELSFSGLDELKAAIDNDILLTRQYFSNRTSHDGL